MRMNLLSERLSGKIRDPSTQFRQEARGRGQAGKPTSEDVHVQR
jgi:hypothetical protein